MTAEYLESNCLDEALETLLDKVVEHASKKGFRASKEGVKSGIGFGVETPYLVAEGMVARGMLDRDGCRFSVSGTGDSFLQRAVEIASLIRGESLFPEFDRGRLIGAVIYALYDWSNTKRGEEMLLDASRVLETLKRLREENPDAFRLAAVTLPRLYYEDGRYTPTKLLQEILEVTKGKALG